MATGQQARALGAWEPSPAQQVLLLRGSFDRDGTRKGTFRMLRVAAVCGLEERAQSEGASAPGRSGP